MEIDSEIAAQMGFSSFGGPAKKRRIGTDEAFTAVEQPKQAPQQAQHLSSGANSTGLGERKPANSAPDHGSGAAPAMEGGSGNLQALRRGIRNERGDTAYFLPSFVEDPWEKLRAKNA